MRETSPAPGWHALPAAEVLAAVGSDGSSGLSPAEAERRLLRFGRNELPPPRRPSLLATFLGQFRSPLIYLLLLAAAVAIAIGKASDAGVIFAVVLLNALIGAFHEGRAERSLEALRRSALDRARAVRDGRDELVEARSLVPGDVLLLAPGDAVAADARLLEGPALQVAEAALTGESLPVSKDALPVAPDTPLADRRNMLYAGTHVIAGRARAVVVATGPATEIGRIAALAESGRQARTPLERRIDRFGRHLAVAAAILFAAIVGVGLLRAVPLPQILMVGIGQVVGVVPEGLPAAMTIGLAVGVQRMARRRAIVRRLAAVETLGSTSVICSDKTGTLTRNEMTATALLLPDGREIAVQGAGYAPEGALLDGGREIAAGTDGAVGALLEAAALCNDAQVLPPGGPGARWQAVGDPTEAALVTLAMKGGVAPAELRRRFPRRAELPFDTAAKMMATQHDAPGRPRVFLKGAPEVVLEACAAARRGGRDEPLDEAGRRALLSASDDLAARALRVLAIAVLDGAHLDGRAGFAGLGRRATLLGLVGQMDPPRPEAEEAVRQCRAAGIRPVMVTGDHRVAAVAVARMLGIAREGDLAVDGRDLDGMPEAQLLDRLDRVAVFARVHPAQKLRIVEAFQGRGEVVAVTGDGVNDAPALVRADVGVAMGLTGTDVAKQAAKIVVTDDDFATIVSAVEEGRLFHDNVKKVVLFLFTTSMAEVLVLLAAMILGYPPPFAAVQILWNNLVTEGVATVNLVMEAPGGGEMRRGPTAREEPLLGRPLLARIAFLLPAMAASTLGWFAVRLSAGVPFPHVQSETFTVLVLCEWFNVLNCRSERRSALTLDILRNPWLLGGLAVGGVLQVAVVSVPALNEVFYTVPFTPREALAMTGVASLVLWVEEARKLVARWRRPPGPAA